MSVLGHDRKTVYHSDLRKACEASEFGRIRVRLLGRAARVLDSQYKDKRPYCPFVVDGEAKGREYQVEHDEIRTILDAAPEGEAIWLRASGGAGEEKIELWTMDGTPIRPGWAKRSTPSSAPADEPPVQRHEAGPGAPKEHEPAGNGNGNGNGGGGRRFDRKTPLSHEYWAALMTAHEIVQAYEDTFGYPPAPAVTAVAATLIIEFNKAGAARPFGTHPIRKPGDKTGLDPNRMVGYRPWEIAGEEPADAPAPVPPKPVRDERDVPMWPGKYSAERKGAVEAMAEAAAAAKRASPFDDEDDDLPF